MNKKISQMHYIRLSLKYQKINEDLYELTFLKQIKEVYSFIKLKRSFIPAFGLLSIIFALL